MPKPLGVIDQLTPEQQDELFDLLNTFTIKEVLAHLTAPAPEGWGLKTHATSLHRFYHRRQNQLLREELEDQLTDGSDPSVLNEEAARALLQRTLANCLAPDHDGKIQKQAFKHLIALEKLALEREKLKLAKEKLELEKAKQLTRALNVSIQMSSNSTDTVERSNLQKAVNSNLDASASLFTLPVEKAPKYTVPEEKTHFRQNNFHPSQNGNTARP